MLSNNNDNPEAELLLVKQDDDQSRREEESSCCCVPEIKLPEPISRITSASPKEDDHQRLLLREAQERVQAFLIKTGGTPTTPSRCDDTCIDVLANPSLGQGSIFLGEDKKDEEDGFRTPEFKIPPECKICPPAPRKRKQSERNKRSRSVSPSSSNNNNACRRILVFDDLEDIDSLFKAVKRTRRDD